MLRLPWHVRRSLLCLHSKALMKTALALHGSIRKADKAAKREDLSKTLKDIKEAKNVANEIPIIGHSMHRREATLSRETMIEQQPNGETNIKNRQGVEEMIFFGGAGKQIRRENPAIDA